MNARMDCNTKEMRSQAIGVQVCAPPHWYKKTSNQQGRGSLRRPVEISNKHVKKDCQRMNNNGTVGLQLAMRRREIQTHSSRGPPAVAEHSLGLGVVSGASPPHTGGPGPPVTLRALLAGGAAEALLAVGRAAGAGAGSNVKIEAVPALITAIARCALLAVCQAGGTGGSGSIEEEAIQALITGVWCAALLAAGDAAGAGAST